MTIEKPIQPPADGKTPVWNEEKEIEYEVSTGIDGIAFEEPEKEKEDEKN